jgi:hypothetical protein
MSGEHAAEQEQIQEEKDDIKECPTIGVQASEQVDQVRTNVFENVSTAKDAYQIIVAEPRDLISAKHIAAGARSTQWLGQITADSLQQLSRDRGHVTVEKDMEPQSGIDEGYNDRYGAGYKLKPANHSEAHSSSGSRKRL